MSGTRSDTFDVRRVRGKTRVYPINGQIVRARGNLPRRSPGNLFGRVYTRLSSYTPRANAHTLQASPTFSARNSEPVGSADRQKFNRWPPPLEQSFVPFLPFFLSFFLYTLQNDYAKQDHGQLISLRQRQLNI